MRRSATTALAVALTLIVGACNGTADDATTTTQDTAPSETTAPTETTAPPDTTAPQADGDTLRVALPIAPRTLSPWTSVAQEMNVTWQIFERLIVFDEESLEYVPALAEDFTWVDDVTMDITLREGLVFSNGEPIDMEAVLFSLEQVLDPEVGGVELSQRTENIESVEQIDDRTLRINFREVRARELNLAGLIWATYVVPPAYFQEVGYDDFSAEPIGSGPFVLVEHVRDSRVLLERNPSYAGHSGPAPGFDQVEFRVLPEPGARVTALRSRDVDLAIAVPIEAVEQLEQDGFEIISIPGQRVQELQVDMSRGMSEISAITEVRQALMVALDRQLIIDTVLFGQGTPLNQLATPVWSGYLDSLPELTYDPERAMELLADAGYPDGVELPLYCPSGAYPKDRELCEVIVSELAKVGISAPMTVLEGGAYFDTILAHEAGPLLYIGRLPPSLAVVDMMSGSTCDGGASYKCDPELDELIEIAKRQTDEQAYLEAVERMVLHDFADPSRIPLWTINDVYGLSPRVSGWSPRSDQVLRLWGVSLDG